MKINEVTQTGHETHKRFGPNDLSFSVATTQEEDADFLIILPMVNGLHGYAGDNGQKRGKDDDSIITN